jgi:hypothetical protein
MKIVYRAADIIEAEIVKGMLVANDIDAHSSGFYLQGGIGEIAPTDLANVLVFDEDYDRARELVREYDENQTVHDSDTVPVDDAGTGPNHRTLVTIIIIIAITVLGSWIVI